MPFIQGDEQSIIELQGVRHQLSQNEVLFCTLPRRLRVTDRVTRAAMQLRLVVACCASRGSEPLHERHAQTTQSQVMCDGCACGACSDYNYMWFCHGSSCEC